MKNKVKINGIDMGDGIEAIPASELEFSDTHKAASGIYSESIDFNCTSQIKLHSRSLLHGSRLAPVIHGIFAAVFMFSAVFFSVLFVGGHLDLTAPCYILNALITLSVITAYLFGERYFQREKYGGRLAVSFFFASTLLFMSIYFFTNHFDFSIFPLGMGEKVQSLLKSSFLYISFAFALLLTARIAFETVCFVRYVKGQD